MIQWGKRAHYPCSHLLYDFIYQVTVLVTRKRKTSENGNRMGSNSDITSQFTYAIAAPQRKIM